MMIRRFAVSIACLMLVCCAWCPADGAQGLPSNETSAAPDFTLQDLDAGKITLSSFFGSQPVMIFFWTTWCPHCRAQLQDIKKTYTDLARHGLALVVIDVGEPHSRVKAFAKRHDLPFPIYLDEDESVADRYGLMGVPTYVLIDKKGLIRSTQHSYPIRQIEELLAD